MRELLPGLHHWRVFHDDIKGDVDCYYGVSDDVGYVLDPLAPKGGLDVFRQLPRPPSHIYMTNRLHDRSCAEFAAAFDALAIADSFIRYADQDGNRAIGFVPDDLIGENVESVKQRTRTRFLELCDDLDFDHLLFAH